MIVILTIETCRVILMFAWIWKLNIIIKILTLIWRASQSVERATIFARARERDLGFLNFRESERAKILHSDGYFLSLPFFRQIDSYWLKSTHNSNVSNLIGSFLFSSGKLLAFRKNERKIKKSDRSRPARFYGQFFWARTQKLKKIAFFSGR